MRYRVTNTRAAWLPMSKWPQLFIVYSPMSIRRLAVRVVAAGYQGRYREYVALDWWRYYRTLETLRHRADFAARNNPMPAIWDLAGYTLWMPIQPCPED